MLTLAVKFRTKPDPVFAQIPLTRRGVVADARVPFTCYPGTGSEQCPDCGQDIAENWVIEAQNPGVATPELGDAFFAKCRAQTEDAPECGCSMFGTVVEMER